MKNFLLSASFRGFELHKGTSTEIDDYRDSDPVDYSDHTWEAQEAFLEDENGLPYSATVYERELYQSPPSEWTEKDGHKIVVCETVLTFHLKTEDEPLPEDFVFEGTNVSYKGKVLDLVNGDDIYHTGVIS